MKTFVTLWYFIYKCYFYIEIPTNPWFHFNLLNYLFKLLCQSFLLTIGVWWSRVTADQVCHGCHGYIEDTASLITTRTTGTFNIMNDWRTWALTLVVFLHKPHLNRLHVLPVTGAPPLVFLLRDYLTQRQVWPPTSALSMLLKHPSNKPHFYHSSVTVVEYLFIYALFSIFLFIIVYLFMYLFIYCFVFLFSVLWILNCRWTWRCCSLMKLFICMIQL